MRRIHEPTAAGIGEGRVVYFLWGLQDAVPTDVAMREGEVASVADDAAALTAHGYTVVLETNATRRTLREALYARDPELVAHTTAAIYWSSHGDHAGNLQLHDGRWVAPGDVDPERVSDALAWVVFSSCHTGKHRGIWQERIGAHVKVVAWNRVVFQAEALAFNTPDEASTWKLDDLIREVLLPGGGGAEAVPDPPEDWLADYDPGVLAFVDDPEEDAEWAELFSVLKPHLARNVAEQLGMTTRQLVWRLGELLAAAGSYQLIGKREEAAEKHDATAAGAKLLVGEIPPLFEASGDRLALAKYLCVEVPRSTLGRAVRRFGTDHAALFECSLRLLLLALPGETGEILRQRLRRVGALAQLPSELWSAILDLEGLDLYEGHARVFASLSAVRNPASDRLAAWDLAIHLAEGEVLDLTTERWAANLEQIGVAALILGITPPPTERWPTSRRKAAAKLERLRKRLRAEVWRTRGEGVAATLKFARGLILLSADYDPLDPRSAYKRVRRISRAGRAAGLPKKLWSKRLRPLSEGRASRGEGVSRIAEVCKAVGEHLRAQLG